MRGLAVASLLLALTTVSGCVEFVDGTQTDLDGITEEADAALADYQAKAGHIAGRILDAHETPLAGAIVELVGSNHSALADPDGGFAFLDLAPGPYALQASAEGYLEGRWDVTVTAGDFVRPRLQLDAVPVEPYVDVFTMQGFVDALGPFTWFCECSWTFPVAEGVIEYILEADLDDNGPLDAHRMHYLLDTYGYGGENATGGEGPTPVYLVAAADELGDTEGVNVQLMPMRRTPLEVPFSQSFHATLSIFYHEGAPEGYSQLR